MYTCSGERQVSLLFTSDTDEFGLSKPQAKIAKPEVCSELTYGQFCLFHRNLLSTFSTLSRHPRNIFIQDFVYMLN